jgi:colicin import membrane protein
MMDSDSSSKFGLSFFLAILFHLLVIAIFVLNLSFGSDKAKTPIQAMQAALLDASQLNQDEQSDDFNSSTPKKVSYLEKKRLAREKKQALLLEQAEKKKLFAAAAQELLVAAIQTKQLEQQKQKEIAALAEQNRLAELEMQRLQQAIEQVKAKAQQKNSTQPPKQIEKVITQQSKLIAQLRDQLEILIGEKIGDLWERPAATDGMNCIIQVHLHTNGRIKNLLVERSSGNKVFDESAKKALSKAGHFQISGQKELPPEVVTEGFSIVFGDE